MVEFRIGNRVVVLFEDEEDDWLEELEIRHHAGAGVIEISDFLGVPVADAKWLSGGQEQPVNWGRDGF